MPKLFNVFIRKFPLSSYKVGQNADELVDFFENFEKPETMDINLMRK